MFNFFGRKKIKHPSGYIYTKTIVPGPGAEAFAFDAGTSPPFTDMYGGGLAVPQMRVLQTSQFFVPQMAAMAATRGTVTGQFILAPLYDPNEVG